jgi:hypothetical protein
MFKILWKSKIKESLPNNYYYYATHYHSPWMDRKSLKESKRQNKFFIA